LPPGAGTWEEINDARASLYYLARGAGSIGKIAPPSAPLNLRIVQ
jgi:hypothetical protein